MHNFLKTIVLYTKSNLLLDLKTNKVYGLLVPGFSIKLYSNKVLVLGAKETYESPISKKQILSAFYKAKVLIKGDTKDLKYIIRKLKAPNFSRNVSYLLNYTKKASDLREYYKRTLHARITIVGCGGIGSNLATLLAGLNFKNLTIIDSDKIEKSNLNRQTIFKLSDIGLFKTDVFEREIKLRYPDCRINKKNLKINPENLEQLFKNSDLIVYAADEPSDLFMRSLELSKANKVPIVTAGYNMGIGKVFFSKGGTKKDDNGLWIYPPINYASSTGPLNYEAASIAASAIIRHYLNLSGKKTIYFNWDSLSLPRKSLIWN